MLDKSLIIKGKGRNTKKLEEPKALELGDSAPRGFGGAVKVSVERLLRSF
jgi:hypothetical protein